MRITIKNPAPAGADGRSWGDYHYGVALQRAFEKLGHSVTQHFWTEWEQEAEEDLILVLRGKRRFTPPAGKLAVMWVISHPSSLTLDEVKRYDLVFVASETHRRMLAEKTASPVYTLRQCTDVSLFHSEGSTLKEREGSVFVANSRGVQRDMLRWHAELGLRPKLIGRGWNSVGLGNWVTQEYLDNAELPELYRAAALGLNDHWADMKYFGYISNRILDCLACGLPVLSDDFPELREYCGDGLLYASGVESFREALREYTRNYPALLRRTAELWKRIGARHTFDYAAAQILLRAEGLPAPTRRAALTEMVFPPAILQAWRSALSYLRLRGLNKSPKFLHVGPSEAAMKVLFDEPTYLSGGIGPGPWHLELPVAEPSDREERFDLILVEEASLPGAEAAFDKWLLSLAKRVKMQQGLIAFPFSEWDERLAGMAEEGFVVVDGHEEWTLLRRTGTQRATGTGRCKLGAQKR